VPLQRRLDGDRYTAGAGAFSSRPGRHFVPPTRGGERGFAASAGADEASLGEAADVDVGHEAWSYMATAMAVMTYAPLQG
jgi:hypothetical protein